VARYHGKKGVVYVSTTGTGAATAVLHLRDWTLNRPTDRVETTATDDSNKTYVQGFADCTGNFNAYWDDTSDQLYDGSTSADGVKLYIYPSSDAATKYFYGPAWIDYSTNGGVSAAVMVAATFAANGAWGQQ
jgi:hypothetical protein